MDAPPPKLLSNTLNMLFNTSTGRSKHQTPCWCSSECLGEPQASLRDTPQCSTQRPVTAATAGRYSLEVQLSYTVCEWKETASHSHSRCRTCSTAGREPCNSIPPIHHSLHAPNCLGLQAEYLLSMHGTQTCLAGLFRPTMQDALSCCTQGVQ